MIATVVTHRSSSRRLRPLGSNPVIAAPRVRRKGGGALAAFWAGLMLFNFAVFVGILLGVL